MNLIEELGLEKCQAIVHGAPEGLTHFKLLLGVSIYYQLSSNDDADLAGLWIDDGDDSYWGLSSYQNFELLIAGNRFISIDDLRIAIANHERIDTCTDIRNHISPLTGVIER